jgi:hypothetical protein
MAPGAGLNAELVRPPAGTLLPLAPVRCSSVLGASLPATRRWGVEHVEHENDQSGHDTDDLRRGNGQSTQHDGKTAQS